MPNISLDEFFVNISVTDILLSLSIKIKYNLVTVHCVVCCELNYIMLYKVIEEWLKTYIFEFFFI